MYLKEIELENFKSFCHKTRIPLLPGYSAITGPNGAGKSNISDAILFVLGPRSSRVIRAGRLTDLIFNGGKSGKAATSCKVSLFIDNSDRLIPLDSDTIKLTRLVKLSDSQEGYYSYYYLNDKKSSLGEIDSLLAHARISADGYNFVQQGDITKIVEMGNVERRRILDDIAGIRRFDDDIARAEKERHEAEENISRLNIIIDEIKKQMKQLEADRESAMKYKDLQDGLLLAKAQLAAKKKEEVEQELSSAQNQIETYEQERVKLEGVIEKSKERIAEIEQQLSKIDERIVEKGGESARELKEKIDQSRIELARARDAIESSEEQIGLLSEEGKMLREEVKKLDKELERLDKSREEQSALIEERNSELKQLRSSRSEKQDLVSKSDSELGNMQEKYEQLVREITLKEDSIRMLSIEQDKHQGRIDRLRGEIAELEENKKTYEFELKDAEWSVKELSTDRASVEKEIKKLQEEFHKMRSEEKKLLTEAKELDDAIKSLTREYNRLKAETDAAKMVAEGYTAAVGRIIEARDKNELKGIHGTVSELCKVDDKFETALTVAAGNRLQAVIVDDDEVASKCIGMLKKNGLGRVIFLPLSKMVEGKARGKAILAAKKSLGYAIDLVDFDERYRPAMWYVLGDTIVVSNLAEARAKMGGIRIVTLEGELIEASGAMIGGTLKARGAKFGASKSSIDKVAQDLRTATEQEEKVNARLWQLRDELAVIEDKLKSSSISDGGQDARLSSLEVKKKEFAQKIAKAGEEIDAKGKELSAILDAQDAGSKQLGSAEKELQELIKARDGLGDKIQKATPKEVAAELKKLESRIVDINADVATATSQRDTIVKQIELINSRKEEIENSLRGISDRSGEHKNRIENSKSKIEELETELNAMRKIEQSMGAEIEKLRNERDGLYKERTDLEAKIDKSQAKIETNEDIIISLRTKIGAADSTLAELISELQGYPVEIGDQKYPPVSELKASIAKFEGELSSLGVVNLRAIEDYNAKKERFDSIKSEISRLKKQKSNLIKLVDELNEKKKIGLLKVFGSIGENFRKIYGELSGGGEAELILENPDEPLSGGLIIKARPRNRKTLRLEALSGGEKSLTALSFIFAIQQYLPSPFYLLDEVDMFLDGVNAENVARVIGKNAANAQFIQVSLRKVTLKEADHIIGVTLQPNSISQVIMKPNVGVELPEEEEAERAVAEEAV